MSFFDSQAEEIIGNFIVEIPFTDVPEKMIIEADYNISKSESTDESSSCSFSRSEVPQDPEVHFQRYMNFYKCPYFGCEDKPDSLNSLKTHINQCHGTSSFECQGCLSKYKLFCLYKQHIDKCGINN